MPPSPPLRARTTFRLFFVVLVCVVPCSCTDPLDDEPAPTIHERLMPVVSAPPRVEVKQSTAEPPEEDEAMQQLRAIGYASGVQPAPGEVGVLTNKVALTQKGLNFVVSGHAPEAVLMDMKGRVLHRWSKTFEELWPNVNVLVGVQGTLHWRRAYLYPNGSLLVVFEGLGIAKLDVDSNVLWENPIAAHHDLAVLPDGDIWVLTRDVQDLPGVATRIPGLANLPEEYRDRILEDRLTRLSPHGFIKDNFSLIDCFDPSDTEHDWPAASLAFWDKRGDREFTGFPNDVFHTNTVALLRGPGTADAPAFRSPNLLVSFRHLDMIAVIDPEQRSVVWSMTGETGLQHDPSITQDEELLVFDNHWEPGRSRVVAFDPTTREITWQYGMEDGQEIYSETCGTVQELRNGNLLIAESNAGRALEITRAGDIVWEFVNPQRAGDDGEFVANLFDVIRLPPGFGASWL